MWNKENNETYRSNKICDKKHEVKVLASWIKYKPTNKTLFTKLKVKCSITPCCFQFNELI